MKPLLIFTACLFLSGCATSVDVDYRSGISFAQVKTFTIQEKPVNLTTDPRIDSPFMQQRTVEALRAAFTGRGFRFQKDKADMLIKFHLVVKQEFETDDSGVFFGIGTSTHHSIFGMSYTFPDRQIASVDDLVLTIDVFDPQNILLWRGSLARRLFSGSTPETNNKLIQGMVAEIMKEFPAK